MQDTLDFVAPAPGPEPTFPQAAALACAGAGRARPRPQRLRASYQRARHQVWYRATYRAAKDRWRDLRDAGRQGQSEFQCFLPPSNKLSRVFCPWPPAVALPHSWWCRRLALGQEWVSRSAHAPGFSGPHGM
jgi:hypothetical protein